MRPRPFIFSSLMPSASRRRLLLTFELLFLIILSSIHLIVNAKHHVRYLHNLHHDRHRHFASRHKSQLYLINPDAATAAHHHHYKAGPKNNPQQASHLHRVKLNSLHSPLRSPVHSHDLQTAAEQPSYLTISEKPPLTSVLAADAERKALAEGAALKESILSDSALSNSLSNSLSKSLTNSIPNTLSTATLSDHFSEEPALLDHHSSLDYPHSTLANLTSPHIDHLISQVTSFATYPSYSFHSSSSDFPFTIGNGTMFGHYSSAPPFRSHTVSVRPSGSRNSKRFAYASAATAADKNRTQCKITTTTQRRLCANCVGDDLTADITAAISNKRLIKIAVLAPAADHLPYSLNKILPSILHAVNVIENGEPISQNNSNLINANQQNKSSVQAINTFEHLNAKYQFRIYYRDTNCSSSVGPLAAFDFFIEGSVDVFFGPLCDYVLAPVTRYASAFWNIPVVTTGGQNDNFDIKGFYYRLLTRMNGSYSQMGSLLVQVGLN